MDDVWTPEIEEKVKGPKYTVECRCGNEMRVRQKHFGRMCRCTKCKYPIYVTPDSVTPPVSASDLDLPRVFSAEEAPVHWRKGDLITESYEVRATLGEGGMGIVYRVYHRGWGVPLAVKSPAARLLGDPDWIDQFEHECETWINLSPHPNVVECFYVRRLGGLPRLFVEFVKGRDLGHMIFEKTIYSGGREAALKRMLDTAIQFAWGLHHAHLEGVIHQDVKPSNVMISEGGHAKVMDFGLAKVWVSADGSRGSSGSGTDRSPSKLSTRGLSGGTPTYRSADHKTYGEITNKVDLWSWGVSMIEMFSGDVYWTKGDDAMNVLENLVEHGSRYHEVPVMPARMQELLRRCFEPRPEDRPDDMRVVAQTLIEIYEESCGETYPRVETVAAENSVDILNNRAVSLVDLQKADESEQIWEGILREDPGQIESLYNIELYRWRSGHITDAQIVEKLTHVCEAHIDRWMPPFLLARVLIERGDSANAMTLLESIPKEKENRRDIAFAQAMAQNYRTRDKRLVWEFKPDEFKVTAVGLSFDGWRALTGGEDGHIRIWEVATESCTTVLEGHEGRVYSVCLSEEERLAVSAGADKTVRVWDPATGECHHVLRGHQGQVRFAVISPNAKFALSGAGDGAMMLWDIRSGKRARLFLGHQGAINTGAISRDGNYVFSGSSDGSVKRWDLWTGECLNTYESSGHRITSLCVSADGATIFAACDTDILFWDAESGRLIRQLRAHQKEVFTICLSENERYALTATGMGTIKVWAIRTGQCIRSFQGHAPAALSRDGRYAISGGKKGDFKLWAVSIDEDPFPAPYMICRGAAGTG